MSGLISEYDIAGKMGEGVAGRIPGRTPEEEMIRSDATAMRIQDAVVARVIYDIADTEGLGPRFDR